MATRRGGKKPGTPNYKLDLPIDIVDEKRPTSLADWNEVAALHHLRSKESPKRCHHSNVLHPHFVQEKERCTVHQNSPKNCWARTGICRRIGWIESDDEIESDDDDDSFSVADDGNFKETTEDDEDDEEEIDNEKVEVVEDEDKQPPELFPRNTTVLLQQLNNTIVTLSNRVRQAPTQASMPQILAMFSLHT